MSSQAIVAGSAGPIEYPIRMTIRRVGGTEIERTWIGQLQTMKALFSSLSGYQEKEYIPQPGSPMATVRARFAGFPDDTPETGEEIGETLSIRFNSVPIPINQHSYFAALGVEAIAELDRLVEEREALSAGDSDLIGADIGSTSLVFEYYWHRRMRIDSFIAKLPIVTYTRTVPFDYSGSLDVAGAGQIFTTAQVSDRVITPLLFTVPTPDIFLDNAFGFLGVGWMLDPQLDYLADGSVQLIETYEWGQYSTKTHESAA